MCANSPKDQALDLEDDELVEKHGAVLETLVDAHCHVHDGDPQEMAKLQCRQVWTMGTRTADWDEAVRWAEQFAGRVVPWLGFHPWFVETAPNADEAVHALSGKLQGKIAGIGEIGLDRVATDRTTGQRPSFETQMALFVAQLALAAERRLPVSVHSVRATEQLLGHVRARATAYRAALKSHERNYGHWPGGAADPAPADPLPPRIMLHSFGGTAQSVRAFLALPANIGHRFFFSFSHAVCARLSREKCFAAIQAVPQNRLLVESDAHSPAAVDLALLRVCRLVGEARGWDMATTARVTGLNSAAFQSSLPLAAPSGVDLPGGTAAASSACLE